MPAAYIELHAHSAFSFLDGVSTPEELADAGAATGYTAMALTDHDGLCGSLAFAYAARDAGVQPITGCEITLDRPQPSHAAGGHRRRVRQPVPADHDRPRPHARLARSPRRCRPPSTREVLGALADGLICLTGCARHGLIPRLVAAGQHRRAMAWLARLREWFPPGHLYIELQRPHRRGSHALVRGPARTGAQRRGPGRRHRRRACPSSPSRLPAGRVRGDRPPPDARRLRAGAPRQPHRGAAHTRSRWPSSSPRSPRPFWPPARSPRAAGSTSPATWGTASPTSSAGHPGETARAALARVCALPAGRRTTPTPPRRAAARARLDQELALIEHHGLAGFFLLHRDILELARDVALEVRPAGSARRQLPPGRGRGSSVGSIVCYLTGLSHIDPIANNLFLGRFLNRDMTSVPDIDLDFPRDIRERLIAEVIRRYGPRARRARGGIPHLQGAHGHPRTRQGARASRGRPDTALAARRRLVERRATCDRSCCGCPTVPAKLRSPRWRALVFLAAQAAGLPRHLSQHSGGMVVSAQPLVEMVPVVPAAIAGNARSASGTRTPARTPAS